MTGVQTCALPIYEEAVEWMMDYIVDRGEWMDEHIDSLRQYCHPSRFANQMLG